MSAQDKTGAPSGEPLVTLDDVQASLLDSGGSAWEVHAFLRRLHALAAPMNPEQPEADYYALEHALQHGAFEAIDDDGDLYAIGTNKLSEYVRWWQQYVSDERATRLRLVRELDVALNGEAGAAQQASLCDLVAQVRRLQPVQILNLPDGMRINFQAPDGRRATLRIDRMLDQFADVEEVFEPGIADVARAAIAAYPVAGVAHDEPHSDAHDAAQVQALAP